MIEVTEVAAQMLTPLLAAEPTRKVLRLYVAGRSCCNVQYGLALDEKAAEGDTLTESRGVPVAIDPLTVSVAEGATIDYVDGSEGTGFVVRGPATGGCGCGRS